MPRPYCKPAGNEARRDRHYYVGLIAGSEHACFRPVHRLRCFAGSHPSNSPVFRNSTSSALLLWIMAANFISWNMSSVLWLAGPPAGRRYAGLAYGAQS